MRYFLQLAYNGTPFHGWQIQPNANTVQAEIEKALHVLFQEKTPVLGCGRTDTGVHAKDFYLHFDTDKVIHPQFIYKLNAIIPKEIAIYRILNVHNDSHARFGATQRTYQYHISPIKNPFTINQAHFFPHSLDLDAMNEAASLLLNMDDFACFCKAGADSKTTICDVSTAFWIKKEQQLIFTIAANRFLRNMVRAVVGTLLEVGQGKINITDFKDILNSKNRSNAGKSVAASGLYLTRVEYPADTF